MADDVADLGPLRLAHVWEDDLESDAHVALGLVLQYSIVVVVV